MMRGTAWIAATLAGMAAGSALAQTVEFRIVERQGQTAVPVPFGTTALTDGVLNFAVQARVVGGVPNTALGNFQFNVHIVGESEANGTLAKMLISNSDGTYAANPNQSVNATVGRGGLASPYTYLAGITGGFFNGLINTSGGTFTNGPDQEILAITGSPTGNSMLIVTDLDGNGSPDTYVGSTPPAAGATATLDPTLANIYFAANGNWIDVYRFKYTLSSTAARFLHLTLEGQGSPVTAQVFGTWSFENGTWGPRAPVNTSVSVSGLDMAVGNPTGACCQREACVVLDRAGCVAGHWQFRGEGAACLPAGTFNACCVGNYNGLNGLEVQDIFDFLSSWFAGDLRADIDQNNVLNVYDIFAFLAAWRNGC